MMLKFLKRFLFVLILPLLILGCNKETNILKGNEKKITLTDEEKKNSDDEIARILIQKALTKEAETAEFTSEEQKEIKRVQNEIKVKYFLERELKTKITITDKELQKYYEANKGKLNDKTMEEIIPILYQNLTNEKYTKALIDYYNFLIDKYKLNDILKEEGIIQEKEEEAKDINSEKEN